MKSRQVIGVYLFDIELGRIGYDVDRAVASFQYSPSFLESNQLKEVFPYTGHIRRVPQVQVFRQFSSGPFRGLPPQFADSLPDLFGSMIFKTWLDARGERDISVIEQLAYVADRGMGALSYAPAQDLPSTAAIDLDEIIEILRAVMDNKKSTTQKKLSTAALINIFKIGSSAGGARPKVLISEHKRTGAVLPGDLECSEDYNHYLVKLAMDTEAFPREIIEYAYHLVATETLGIDMMGSKLIDDKHFATLRYDRQGGEKQHVLTASGLTGWDFQDPATSSYEHLFRLCSFLKIPQAEVEALYRRMVFNVVFRNTDDHMKNHAFVYTREEDRWHLAPAYDLTYALNPLMDFRRANRALSINGKRSDISRADLNTIAEAFTVKNATGIIQEVNQAISVLALHLSELKVPHKIRENVLKKVSPIA